MCPSGTGRFIADSWFSDEPLPAAYTTPAAARVRETGGVGGKTVDREAVEAYLREVDLPKAIDGMCAEAEKIGGLRGQYLAGLALSLRPCGTWRWKFSAKASRFRTSVASRPRPASCRSRRSRKPSAIELPSCWTVADIRRRSPAACWVRSMPGAASASRPDGVGARAGRGGHRVLRQSQRGEPAAAICRRNWRLCRAPTSTSCPSRTRGSPAP